MKKPKIVIVGNNIVGLTCAYFFRNIAEVTVIGKKDKDDEFNNVGSFYTKETPKLNSFLSMIDALHLSSEMKIRNGLFLKGNVERRQTVLRKMKQDRIQRLREDFYRKTRLMEPPKKINESIFSAYNNPQKTIIRASYSLLYDHIKNSLPMVNFENPKVVGCGCKSVYLVDESVLYYDFLIFTLPLWDIKKIVWWNIPYCNALKKNLIKVKPLVDSRKYFRWNYVYTPYTPANLVHRITQHESGYCLEISGSIKGKLGLTLSDLYYLFPKGWSLEWIKIVKGYMYDFDIDFENWPQNIAPVGRYAQWLSGIDFSYILDRISILKNFWGF